VVIINPFTALVFIRRSVELRACEVARTRRKFWLSVLTEPANSGVETHYIALLWMALKGFPDAIMLCCQTMFKSGKNVAYQRHLGGIVHMVRYSLKFVSWKDSQWGLSDLL